MESIQIILAALLSVYIPGDFACHVVEANPAVIEIFCVNEQTGKLKFTLIERTGVVVVVNGLSL